MNGYNQEKSNSYHGILSKEGKPVVYVHDTLSVPGLENLQEKVRGIERYAERVIPLGSKEDTVFLRSEPDQVYLNYLESVGFEIPKINVLDGSSLSITKSLLENTTINGEYNGQVFAPFYGGELEKQAADRLGATFYASESVVTETFYDKAGFKNICKNLGLKTAEGQIFDKNSGEKVLEDLIKRYLQDTGRVIIRGTKGASGTSAHIITKENYKEKMLEVMTDKEKEFLVESMYHVTSSPSSIFMITPNKTLYHLADTEQLLDDNLVHQGNNYDFLKEDDNKQELNFIGQEIGKKMAESGYIGPFGIDYIITDNGLIIPTECNARMTGAVYPLDMVRKIENITNENISYARSKNVQLKGMKSLEQLLYSAPHSLFFNGKNSSGIFPYNTGVINEGKLTAVFSGDSKEEVDNLENSFNIFINN